ncbi:MAG: hypothetical protein SFW62_09065 [Alphaproteobacteria bacterium]|nr:hypothetical protein [Alphaproteobacteria bacterium]
MATDKPPADLTALAAEALDLWQEHLASYAADPKAKKEMMRLLEPSRRLFADWATMMQHGPYGTSASASAKSAVAAARPEAARPASDDGALRLAQLAHRVAELEKRLAELESGGAGKAAKTGQPSAKPKSRV